MSATKIIGVVTSDVQDKTIVITETTRETHPLYGKKYTRERKFVAHDEKNEAKKGDTVEIVEVRPISKSKHFQLDRIVERGHENVDLKKTILDEEAELKVAAKLAKKEAEKEVATADSQDAKEDK